MTEGAHGAVGSPLVPPGRRTIASFWSATKSVLIAAAVAVVVANIAEDLLFTTYAIDEPPAAGEKAAPQKLAPLLRDEMGRLTRAGYIDSIPQPEAVEADQPKFKVADTEFSLGFATTLIRKALGLRIKHVSGDLEPSGDAGPCQPGAPPPSGRRASDVVVYHLTLRASDDGFGPFFQETGCIDDVMTNGAIATLEQVDPVTAAGALSSRPAQEDKEAALRLIEATIAAEKEANATGAKRILPFLRIGLHRALLMRGLIEERLDRHEEAAVDFVRSDDAFRDGILRSPHHWHIAEDSLAYASIKLADQDSEQGRDASEHFAVAADAVASSLKEEPGYDSAVYHRAMIDDHKARAAFNAADRDHPTTSDLCPARAAAMRAREGYGRLLEAHPTFTIAHYDWAVLDIQELRFIQGHDRLGCAGMGAEAVEPTVAALDREADRHLHAAVAADPSLRIARLQLAYLFMQRQEPAYVHPGRTVPSDALRLACLESARAEVEAALLYGPADDGTKQILQDVTAKEAGLRPSAPTAPPSACGAR